MEQKINEIDSVLLYSFKKTIVYAATFEILGIIVAIVSHNIYAAAIVSLFFIALLLTVVYRVCRCLDGKINKYIGKCVYIYTPAVAKKISGFERPYIILQNDQGQNIKFFYNKSLSAELGNTVTIFAPYSSVFQESENVFVICSYLYSYISDYSNLTSN